MHEGRQLKHAPEQEAACALLSCYDSLYYILLPTTKDLILGPFLDKLSGVHKAVMLRSTLLSEINNDQ